MDIDFDYEIKEILQVDKLGHILYRLYAYYLAGVKEVFVDEIDGGGDEIVKRLKVLEDKGYVKTTRAEYYCLTEFGIDYIKQLIKQPRRRDM